MPVEINKNGDFTTINPTIHEVKPAETYSAPTEAVKPVDDIRSYNNINGLSARELNDPNSINVTVSDPNIPLVVLFGPPACGKTMTLVRLTRFLKNGGYAVEPIRSFRPSADTNYTNICENFDVNVNSNNAAKANDRISFMLVVVMKKGEPLCQILEAPGEFYFDPANPNAPFPNYVNTIIHNNNRKIWIMMVEPDWYDHTDRMNYVTKITNLTRFMKPKDKVVFLYNKIDKSKVLIHFGHINVVQAIKDVENSYPNIFVPFMNQNPITKLWKKYNCNFVPFQTGTFVKGINGLVFQEGPQEYCENLWRVLMGRIYG